MSTSSDVSTNNYNLRQIVGEKTLPHSQKDLSLMANDREFLYQQPTVAPSFGTTSQISIVEQGVVVHRNIIQIVVSKLAVNTTALIPASCMFPRITVESNGKLLQTILPQHQWIIKNTKYTDLQRNLTGEGLSGPSDLQSRINSGQLATQTLWCVLEDFILMGSQDYLIATPQHNLTYKITLASLRDCLSPNDSPGATVLSMTLISEISRPSNLSVRINNLVRFPEVQFFPDVKQIQTNIGIGQTSVNQQLLFNGAVIGLFFVVQLANNIGVQENLFSNFLPVTNFTLLNSRNENLVHKASSIDANFFLKVLSKSIYNSNITIDTAAITNSTQKNIYFFNCSSDVKRALNTGALCGTRQLTTVDMLNVNLPANAAATVLTTYLMFENSITQYFDSPSVVGVV